MNRRNVFALGLALAVGGAGSAFLMDGVVADSPPLLSILSPPGAGYDSTNVALYGSRGEPVTVTRAGTQSCQDSSGTIRTVASNKPCLRDGASLLVEPAGTNLLLRSSEFDNASWVKTNITITANAIAAPDGNLTADKVESTSSGALMIQDAAVSATSATCSAYVKKGSSATEANRFVLRNVTTATNLADVTVNYDAPSIIGTAGATFTSIGGGWFRVVVPMTSGITSGDTIRCYNFFTGGGGAGHYAYGWCGQLEAGSVATSCIPTAGATATRAATTATVTTPAVGTSFCAAVTVRTIDSTGAARGLWSFGTPWTAANTVGAFVQANGTLVFRVYDGSAVDKGWTSTETVSAGDRIRFCYASGTVAGQKNGAALTLSTSGAGAGTFTAPATTYLGSLGAALQASATLDGFCFSKSASGCQ